MHEFGRYIGTTPTPQGKRKLRGGGYFKDAIKIDNRIGKWKLSPSAKNNKLLILVVAKGGMKSYSAKKDAYLLVAGNYN